MKRNASLFFALLGLVFLLYSFVFLFQQFQIRKVIIISSQPNIHGLEILNQQNLFFVDSKRVSDHLMKRNQAIQKVSLAKKYPKTLTIEVDYREPIAQVVVGDSRQLYIDEDGMILLWFPISTSLAKIEAPSIAQRIGEKADWRIVKASTILKEFTKVSILIDRILIDDGGNTFVVDLTDGGIILVPYNSDAIFLAASLQIIMSRFRIEGKFISKVDFRFDKPIVILSNGEKISSP